MRALHLNVFEQPVENEFFNDETTFGDTINDFRVQENHKMQAYRNA